MKPSVNESCTNLKTLKDLEMKLPREPIHLYRVAKKTKDVFEKKIRQEAIKWYKEKRALTSMDWERFFNITEDDIQNVKGGKD